MITISVIKETVTDVSSDTIIEKLTTFLQEHGIKDNAEMSVCLVNKQQMLRYVEKHLHETGEEAKAHPVLSFVQSETEGDFKFPPDDVSHLGEIIASVDHAADEKELYELIEHGALHLLGIHHK